MRRATGKRRPQGKAPHRHSFIAAATLFKILNYDLITSL